MLQHGKHKRSAKYLKRGNCCIAERSAIGWHGCQGLFAQKRHRVSAGMIMAIMDAKAGQHALLSQ